jgi:hypothetical protein
MDPITGFMAIAGLGVSLFGSSQASKYQSEAAQASQRITGLEEQENQQRQLAMNISARRQSVDALRKAQQASARGEAAAANQGGLQSSGYQGGQAEATAEGAFNVLGIQQNQAIGNTMFGIQGQISQQQILQSQLQSTASTYQGIASIGSALSQSAGPLGKILGNAFSFGQGGQGGPQTSTSSSFNPWQVGGSY